MKKANEMNFRRSNRERRGLTASLFVLLLIGTLVPFLTVKLASASDEWWNDSWSSRIRITFNNTAISENLINFSMPIIFDYSQSHFWSYSKSDGSDLRFIDPNASELYFELESWNSTTQEMVAWVKVPRIDANSQTSHIWLYYGNGGASFDNYNNKTQVWDNNFKGVWHFNELSGAKAYDSTINKMNGTANGGITEGVAGKLGKAFQWDGVLGTYLGGDSSYASMSSWTVGGWFKPPSGNLGRYSNIWACSQGDLFPNQIWPSGQFGVWRSSGSVISKSNSSAGNWCYGVCKSDGTMTYVYFNGEEESTGTTINSVGGNWIIGDKTPGSTVERFEGVIDEVRLSNISRSAQWIKAEFLYTRDRADFIYGEPEAKGTAKIYVTPLLVEKTRQDVGTTFKLNVTIETNVTVVWAFDINLTWSSSLLTLASIDCISTLDSIWGPGNWFLAFNESGAGYCELAAVSTFAGFTSPRAQALVTFEFRVSDSHGGTTPIHFDTVKLSNSKWKPIPLQVTDGFYRITAPQAKLYVEPSLVEKTPSDVGTTFEVNMTTIDVVDLFGIDLNLTWKNDLITLVGAEYQTTLDTVWGADNWVKIKNETGPGWYKLVAVSTSSGCNISNAKTLATLTFRVESSQNWDAETTLHFAVKKLSNSQAQLIQLDDYDGTYSIRGTSPTLKIQAGQNVFRIYGEACHISIVVSDAANVKGCTFEIYFNTSMLDYVNGSEVWGTLGTGVLMANETEGKLQGTIGPAASINGSQWLVNFTFNEVYHHVWKDESQAPTWRNNQTGRIWFHWANLSYADHPDLGYTEGGLNQINTTEADITFSPIKGDVDNNGRVDVFDLRIIGYYYSINISDPEWPTALQYDLNGNDIIEIQDLIIAESNFGYTYNG